MPILFPCRRPLREHAARSPDEIISTDPESDTLAGTATPDPDGLLADAGFRRRLRQRLLRWFDRHRRDLPWRHGRDPYRIWVSEIMLQQTQAVTVARHFGPFLEAFPTIAALASADEQAVLRLWEGLGYYRRARDLHRAAQVLAERHGGRFPDDAQALGDVPGIGRYTLGAVLSQAFDRRLPILEVNSRRVLSRLFGVRGEVTRGPAQRWLWHVAEEILPRRRVGDFNQSLMELGALVCTPARPRCSLCPIAADCAAFRRGLQDTVPARSAAPAPVHVREAAVVVSRQGRVLLVQRPSHGRWANLWEFPHGELLPDETHEAAVARLLPALTGIRGSVGPELMMVRHTIMHYRVTVVCFESRHRAGRFLAGAYQDGRWLLPNQLSAYPVSMPQRRLAQALTTSRQQRLF